MQKTSSKAKRKHPDHPAEELWFALQPDAKPERMLRVVFARYRHEDDGCMWACPVPAQGRTWRYLNSLFVLSATAYCHEVLPDEAATKAFQDRFAPFPVRAIPDGPEAGEHCYAVVSGYYYAYKPDKKLKEFPLPRLRDGARAFFDTSSAGGTQGAHVDRVGEVTQKSLQFWRYNRSAALDLPGRGPEFKLTEMVTFETPMEPAETLRLADAVQQLLRRKYPRKSRSQGRITTSSADKANVASRIYPYADHVSKWQEDLLPGSRRSLINRIWCFVNDPTARRGYMIITGEPGIGKTALLARLIEERDPTKPTLNVYHFNRAQLGLFKRRQFLENICARLIMHHHLPYQSLPPDFAETGVVLHRLLCEAAGRLKPGYKLVIPVDAVDEIEHEPTQWPANTLFLPSDPPEGVYFVLTARTRDHVRIQANDVTTCAMIPDDPENELDARLLIRSVLGQEPTRSRIARDRGSLRQLEDVLWRKSNGNFMYLHFVLRDIARDEQGALDLGALPQGLREYYRFHWERMRRLVGATFEHACLPIVLILAAVREPVTAEQIAKWTDFSIWHVKEIIGRWVEFCRVSRNEQGSHTYTLYHGSFMDFFAEEIDPGLAMGTSLICRGMRKTWDLDQPDSE